MDDKPVSVEKSSSSSKEEPINGPMPVTGQPNQSVPPRIEVVGAAAGQENVHTENQPNQVLPTPAIILVPRYYSAAARRAKSKARNRCDPDLRPEMNPGRRWCSYFARVGGSDSTPSLKETVVHCRHPPSVPHQLFRHRSFSAGMTMPRLQMEPHRRRSHSHVQHGKRPEPAAQPQDTAKSPDYAAMGDEGKEDKSSDSSSD